MRPFSKLTIVVLFLLAAFDASANITSVVNGASFVQNTGLTPGSIITIKGSNLTNATASATDLLNLPTSLGGVKVTIGGIVSKLIYVSPTQVNTQIDPVVGL